MSSAYVAIATEWGERAIAKLVPLADGGWSLIPLLNPDPFPGWWLAEIATDYSRGGTMRSHGDDLLAEYRSDHPVKLSVHGGGFVQFSRVGQRGVVSGRDKISRRPRGLGYESRPVTDPPRSGSMFTMTAWGLEEYPYLRPNRQAIVFGENDLYDQWPDSAEIGTAYALDCWPLPRYALAAASISTTRRLLNMPGHPFYAGQPFQFTVLDTGNPLMILGLVVTRFRSGFPSPAGATIGAPSDRRMERALTGILPRPDVATAKSADFVSSESRLAEPRRILPVVKWLSDAGLARRPWGRRSAAPGAKSDRRVAQ
jgi:hypothetical protein